MEPSNDSFLALLEERISKRDGNSGKKLIVYFMPRSCRYFKAMAQATLIKATMVE